MKMEKTVCSETSAQKIQTPAIYPKERTQHSKHGGSLKPVIFILLFTIIIIIIIIIYYYFPSKKREFSS